MNEQVLNEFMNNLRSLTTLSEDQINHIITILLASQEKYGFGKGVFLSQADWERMRHDALHNFFVSSGMLQNLFNAYNVKVW